MKKWQKASAGSERRHEERSVLLLRAALVTPYGEVRVYVRNLSQGGALVDGDHPVWPGMEVVLKCGDSEMPARVAWCEEPRFGLAFDAPLDEQEVARLVRSK
ncbi:MAG TPA: PilZ domain-containing protein [Allosphingosinicella sp.]|nr:PilZ domain-containing protein [Allosphingosinicella sp.]